MANSVASQVSVSARKGSPLAELQHRYVIQEPRTRDRGLRLIAATLPLLPGTSRLVPLGATPLHVSYYDQQGNVRGLVSAVFRAHRRRDGVVVWDRPRQVRELGLAAQIGARGTVFDPRAADDASGAGQAIGMGAAMALHSFRMGEPRGLAPTPLLPALWMAAGGSDVGAIPDGQPLSGGTVNTSGMPLVAFRPDADPDTPVFEDFGAYPAASAVNPYQMLVREDGWPNPAGLVAAELGVDVHADAVAMGAASDVLVAAAEGRLRAVFAGITRQYGEGLMRAFCPLALQDAALNAHPRIHPSEESLHLCSDEELAGVLRGVLRLMYPHVADKATDAELLDSIGALGRLQIAGACGPVGFILQGGVPLPEALSFGSAALGRAGVECQLYAGRRSRPAATNVISGAAVPIVDSLEVDAAA